MSARIAAAPSACCISGSSGQLDLPGVERLGQFAGAAYHLDFCRQQRSLLTHQAVTAMLSFLPYRKEVCLLIWKPWRHYCIVCEHVGTGDRAGAAHRKCLLSVGCAHPTKTGFASDYEL